MTTPSNPASSDTKLREDLARYVAGLATSGNNFMTEAVTQEVRDGYVDSLMRLFTAQQRQLLERLKERLPRKSNASVHKGEYEFGHDKALDQVSVLIDAELKKLG